jgi:hypothetical protein
MDHDHRGYLIHSGASVNPNTNKWTPTLTVFWSEGTSKMMAQELLFTITFPTEQEAELCARHFGVTWVDAGKPQLPKGG